MRYYKLALLFYLSFQSVGIAVPEVKDDKSSIASGTKASFLHKLILFSEWPNVIKRDKLKIGILDNADIYQQLKSMSERLTSGSDYQLFYFETIDNYQRVDLLWAGDMILGVELDKLRDGSILLIGEGINCWRQNLHVCLIEEDNQLRFKLDLYSFKRSGLKISSKVIRLAQEIRR
jgi:hypothetical protein